MEEQKETHKEDSPKGSKKTESKKSMHKSESHSSSSSSDQNSHHSHKASKNQNTSSHPVHVYANPIKAAMDVNCNLDNLMHDMSRIPRGHSMYGSTNVSSGYLRQKYSAQKFPNRYNVQPVSTNHTYNKENQYPDECCKHYKNHSACEYDNRRIKKEVHGEAKSQQRLRSK